MASFRKRYGKWQARIQRKGLPSITQSFHDYNLAQKWARKVEREIDLGIINIKPKKTLFKKCLIRYNNDILPLKKNFLADRYRLLRILKYPISQLYIDDIKSMDISRFRDRLIEEGKAPNTVRLYLAIISHIFTVAQTEWGIPIITNPCLKVRRPKLPKSFMPRISDAEIELILKHTQSLSLPVAVKLALHTGMRLSEIVNLQWQQINLEQKMIRLFETKNGERRIVPLSQRAVDLLLSTPRYDLNVFNVNPHAISKAFGKACVRSNVQGISFHSLRHEAISRFFEMGLNPMEVAAISGHKSMQVLKHYTHIKPEYLLDKLNSG